MTKVGLYSLALVIPLLASSAEAAVCSARSATGSWGVGRGYNFRQARALALTYCAVNTPRGYTCYVTGCRY